MVNSRINYCTKDDLYKYVAKSKEFMGIKTNEIGLDFYEACSNIKKLDVRTVNFKDRSLRGLSVPKENIILLNSSRNRTERNFDCAHEFMHVIKHKNENFQTFNCFDTLRPQQSPYLEWQANEGAAEMLVPYKIFIPMFCGSISNCETYADYYSFLEFLSCIFNVPIAVIELRVDNLKYEIHQYENGCDINHIRLLSNKKQAQRGIHITSYNTLFDLQNWII